MKLSHFFKIFSHMIPTDMNCLSCWGYLFHRCFSCVRSLHYSRLTAVAKSLYQSAHLFVVFHYVTELSNQLSISLGNRKPLRLLEVKRQIWEFFFSVANGRTTTECGIMNLLHTCDSGFLDSITDEEKYWFRLGKICISACL